MKSEKDILVGCMKGRPSAQKALFDSWSPIMLGVCRRYAQDRQEAEDIMQEGFVKVFLHIDDFRGGGSLGAWMRKIMVNTAITHYHRTRKHRYHEELEEVQENRFEEHSWDSADFTREELQGVLDRMPEGYRVVFNLYAVEGYKHREIAEVLGIDENTSKSQYSRGRRWLQEKLLKIRNSEDQYQSG